MLLRKSHNIVRQTSTVKDSTYEIPWDHSWYPIKPIFQPQKSEINISHLSLRKIDSSFPMVNLEPLGKVRIHSMFCEVMKEPEFPAELKKSCFEILKNPETWLVANE